MADLIRVAILRPRHDLLVTTLEHKLEEIQASVGGYAMTYGHPILAHVGVFAYVREFDIAPTEEDGMNLWCDHRADWIFGPMLFVANDPVNGAKALDDEQLRAVRTFIGLPRGGVA